MRTEDELRRALGGALRGEVDLAAGRKRVAAKARRDRARVALAAMVGVLVLAVGTVVATRDSRSVTPVDTGGGSRQARVCERQRNVDTVVAEGSHGADHWVLVALRRPARYDFMVAIPGADGDCGRPAGSGGDINLPAGRSMSVRFGGGALDKFGALAVGSVAKDVTSIEVVFRTGERRAVGIIDTGDRLPTNAFIVLEGAEPHAPYEFGTSIASIIAKAGNREAERRDEWPALACDAGEVGRYDVAPLATGRTRDLAIEAELHQVYVDVPYTRTQPDGTIEEHVLRGDRLVGAMVVDGEDSQAWSIRSDLHCAPG